MKKGYVYILSNYNRTALYVGMTNDIEDRVLRHKAGIGSVHTAKYKLKYLMYFETCPSIQEAIAREKQLKNWRKEWKWNLIKESNPNLNDLAHDWFDEKDVESVKTGNF
ncbi:GIY-YIG nuclease family protein [Ekhidna sp.]|uniref:GIY-YIG nuclease family protein n=1 Tax=Ekhidna sp. TaxID=2608089 RepID=UPI003BA94AE7